MYNLYSQVFNKLEQKENLIENYIRQKNTGNQEEQPSSNMGTVSTRNFPVYQLKETQKNLVIGSSLVSRLMNDHSFPDDCTIHAYRGSTTKEKIAIVEKYTSKKLDTVILQYGTNDLLKNGSASTENLFDDFNTLVEAIREKFEPTNFVICEVPPVLQNEEMNQKITEFNKLIHEKFDEGFTVLNLNHMYRRLPNMQSFYYDNFHFNHHRGLAVLKNALLSQLLRTSSGVSTKHYTSYNRKPMRTNQNQYTTQRWHIPYYTQRYR